MTVYHLQRELQACVDMWRATGSSTYLEQATDLALCAVEEARENPRPLMWHGESRGEWPCFYLDTVAAQTGGHSQLCDFQGAAGFLSCGPGPATSSTCPTSRQIADFVEQDIVRKWLYYKPSIKPEHLTGPESRHVPPGRPELRRAVREHFACICLDLHAMGYDSYPYRDWAKLLIDLYLTPRYDPGQPAPYEDLMPERIPRDWGLPVVTTADGVVWLSIPDLDPNNPTGRAGHLACQPHRVAGGEGLCGRARRPERRRRPCQHASLSDLGSREGPVLLQQLRRRQRLQARRPRRRAGRQHLVRLASPGRLQPATWKSCSSRSRTISPTAGPTCPTAPRTRPCSEAPLCLEAWAARLLTAGQTRTFP